MAGELKRNSSSLIINELQQGKDLARQLQIHLSTSSTSDQTREWLAQKILESYETALSFLGRRNDSTCEFMQHPPAATLIMSESPPRSLCGSPRSQELLLDHDQFKDQEGNKKRKCLRKWTKQVQVRAGREFEGPLEDGYSWRKYGQKDILGAKYPRGYYRCSHRNVQNCLATKQAQRSDQDPEIFNITYSGIHTCDQNLTTQHYPLSPSTSISSPKQDLKDATKPDQPQEESLNLLQQFPQEVFLDFKTGLRVLTQDSIGTSPQFCFPSTSSSQSSTLAAGYSNSYYTCPSLGNPNYDCCNNNNQVMSYYNGGGNSCQNLHGSLESKLTEIISAAATSASNSPTVAAAALDFDPFGNQVGSDPSFTFDNHWRL